MAIIPYLLYEDVDKAMEFLAKAFGFRKYGRPMLADDGKVNHAAMQFGHDLIMMGRPPSGYRNPKHLGGATQYLYVNVEKVDKHYQRAKNAGATVLEAPEDTEYGHRRYSVADPEGHQWSFAEDIKRRVIKKSARKRSAAQSSI